MRRTTLIPLLLPSAYAATYTLDGLVQQWATTSSSYNFSMPSSTTSSNSSVQNWLEDQWALSGRISWGANDISFVQDPSTPTNVRRAHASVSTSSPLSPSSTATSGSSSSSSSSDVVLRIEYPSGSYSSNTGGTQFNLNPISGTNERMIMAYDIYFSDNYQWVQGGKLPGLRGGPDRYGCSGGNETDGTGCFSTRVMWRTAGAGEIYAYIPTSQKDFCSASGVTCNSDYGTSLDRGSFSFVSGQWQTVWMVVILNDPTIANGVVELYYNGVQAMSFQDLELRSSDSLSSVNGIFFSTFFGGSDSSWATPETQYTYFRNMQLFAGSGQATGSGAKITGAASSRIDLASVKIGRWTIIGVVVSSLFAML